MKCNRRPTEKVPQILKIPNGFWFPIEPCALSISGKKNPFLDFNAKVLTRWDRKEMIEQGRD